LKKQKEDKEVIDVMEEWAARRSKMEK